MRKSILGAAALAALAFVWSAMTSDHHAGTTRVAEDSHDITSEAQKSVMAALIQANGFNCPEVLTVHLLPQDAYGIPARVLCNNAVHFIVTLRPDETFVVRPE